MQIVSWAEVHSHSGSLVFSWAALSLFHAYLGSSRDVVDGDWGSMLWLFPSRITPILSSIQFPGFTILSQIRKTEFFYTHPCHCWVRQSTLKPQTKRHGDGNLLLQTTSLSPCEHTCPGQHGVSASAHCLEFHSFTFSFHSWFLPGKGILQEGLSLSDP